jgi:hypothetical protein
MRITKHITFFFREDRIEYINRIICETNTYKHSTDIFIHTNEKTLRKDMLSEYINGTLTIISHDFSQRHPHYLTWSCRGLMRDQRDEYDIFIYIEDDILVPRKAIDYWLERNEELISLGYNLGFVRIEMEGDIEYMTDLLGETYDTVLELNGKPYCLNNINPYCAFWIYNKSEFTKFVESPYYHIENIHGYDERAASAIGLHGTSTPWYKGTVIPLKENKLIGDCRLYHMPNNYVNRRDGYFEFARLCKFTEAISGTCTYKYEESEPEPEPEPEPKSEPYKLEGYKNINYISLD